MKGKDRRRWVRWEVRRRSEACRTLRKDRGGVQRRRKRKRRKN